MDVDLELTVRYGAITHGTLTLHADGGASDRQRQLSGNIIGAKVHEVQSWDEALSSELDALDPWQRQRLVEWLERMLPRAPAAC